MPLPVVSMAREGSGMTLLARSIDEYLARALAEEESALGGPGPAAEAAGAAASDLYAPGALASSGLPSLDAFLVRKARQRRQRGTPRRSCCGCGCGCGPC